MKDKLSLFYLIVLSVLLFSCNEYNKLIKSDDLQLKYTKAIEYYENEEYAKAYPLIEELIIIYRGTSKSELLSYYLSNCDFYLGDFSLASFRYKNFANTFPVSQYAEECRFKSAYCQYKNSPKYSLDQSSTYVAISELQLFTSQYPYSSYLDSCNVLIDQLRGKLQRKHFENAKQYYHMRDYKAAVVMFDQLLKDFPGTNYKEEALYLTFKSEYFLAINSISSKKLERIDDSIKSYIKFVDSFPQSEFVKDAEGAYESILKEKEKINAINKS